MATTCVCWLGVLFLYPPTGYAQYRFDHWTADHGLPQNIITALHQTRDGYLWLTTFDGLALFDGVRFTVFSRAADCTDVTIEKR